MKWYKCHFLNLSFRSFKILFSVSFLDDSSLADAATKTFWRFPTWVFRKSRSAVILCELSVSAVRESLGGTIIVFGEDFETPVWGGVFLEKICKSVWIWPIFVSNLFICKVFGGLDLHGFRYKKIKLTSERQSPLPNGNKLLKCYFRL